LAITELDAALGQVERILLDSSGLIAFHDPSDPTNPLVDHLFRRIENNRDPLRGYYSVISAVEILIRPLRTGTGDFTSMHAFLAGYPNLSGLPVDLTVALQAANVRATTNLRLPDAGVVASALLAGCEAVVTNDQRWRTKLEPLFRQFRWIYLDDYR
jgi:predicted nucleic acid-binding protein